MSARTPAIVLGGTGYVAGELVRLVLGHPRLELAAVASDSQPGEPVAKAFPHLAALKNMTSQLTGRFVAPTMAATRERFGDGRLTRYAADVVVPAEQRSEVAVLKALANLFVFQRPQAAAIYARQQEVVLELVEAITTSAPESLDASFGPTWAAAPNDAAAKRVIIDQVASLTDRSVLRWHSRLCR